MDNIENNQIQLNEIKYIMKDNIEKIVNRNENLNELHESCENLELAAQSFQTTSSQVKNTFERSFFRKNKCKLAAAIGCITSLLSIMIICILIYYFLLKK